MKCRLETGAGHAILHFMARKDSHNIMDSFERQSEKINREKNAQTHINMQIITLAPDPRAGR